MDRSTLDAVARELVGQPVGAVFRAGEDQRLLGGDFAQQVAQHCALLSLLDEVHAVLDELRRRVPRRDFDGDGDMQQPGGQRPDLVREGGRKEQVLSLLRQHGEHAADVADEPHVEHPVRLVEHEMAHLREVDGALGEVIEQPARCGDDDVHPLAERIDLRARADATEDQDRALVRCRP